MMFVPLESIELAAWNVQRAACNRMMITAHNTTIERRIYDIPSLSKMRREGDASKLLEVADILISTIK